MTNLKHNKTFIFVFLITLMIFSLTTISWMAGQDTVSNETEATEEIVDYPPETIIASFGDFTITLEDLNLMWEKVPPEYKSQITKSNLLDQMISEKLLLQDAISKNLKNDEKIALQIEDMTNQILIQALIEKEVLDATDVSDEEAEEYYNNNPAEFTEKEQVHLFNIMVETEEEAELVRNAQIPGQELIQAYQAKKEGKK